MHRGATVDKHAHAVSFARARTIARESRAAGKMTSKRSGLGILRQKASVCVFYSLSVLLLLPLTVFADPGPERASAVSNLQSANLSPALLEASGVIIGAITIDIDDIFDLENPEENKWIYELANKAHPATRPQVVRQQLLFKSGDPFSARVMDESERLLRSNRYIQDAHIRPVRFEDGIVDIDVQTIDTWTFIPRISLSRQGGENSTGFGLKELNLFGTGMQIGVTYKSDVDRDSTIIKFFDRNLGNSWYSLGAVYENNSDGYVRQLGIEKPFYSLVSTDARGISLLDEDRIDALYDRGEILAEYRHQTESYGFYSGWSKGLINGWTRRYTTGLAFEEHRFSPADGSTVPISIVPADRKFDYPFIGIELMQDRFEKTENLNQIHLTEDRFLGARVSARIGYASKAVGSDRNAWLINAQAQTGFGSSSRSSLLLASSFTTRVESDSLQNLTIQASANYHKRQSGHRLFYASLSGVFGHNLDVDNQVLLGGDNGLRGYPLRYLSGDKSALLTIEQRFFSDWYPFRLIRVGGAVFFDAGRTWGESPVGSDNPGLQTDVGFGLRLGNARSGLARMIHVDLAFPLGSDDNSIDNVQLLIEAKSSF